MLNPKKARRHTWPTPTSHIILLKAVLEGKIIVNKPDKKIPAKYNILNVLIETILITTCC